MRERFIRLHSLNEASLEERRDRHTAARGKQTCDDRPVKEVNVMESAFICEDFFSTRNKICFAVENSKLCVLTTSVCCLLLLLSYEGVLMKSSGNDGPQNR